MIQGIAITNEAGFLWATRAGSDKSKFQTEAVPNLLMALLFPQAVPRPRNAIWESAKFMGKAPSSLVVVLLCFIPKGCGHVTYKSNIHSITTTTTTTLEFLRMSEDWAVLKVIMENMIFAASQHMKHRGFSLTVLTLNDMSLLALFEKPLIVVWLCIV